MQPGETLLHYRIVEKIGEGGMGVVWKALDTTLDREVAVKVLPDAFSHELDRLGRFEREAKLLASLNHPNIATLHGLHEARPAGSDSPVRFLAMELVHGEDLAARLARGPLAVEEVPAVAAQIASALEAAHAQGVIHRDLKPANVVLTPDGKVKVLDFGLAKIVEPDAASASGALSLSPTITSRGTAAGMIMGTAAYMSPEQARGRPVDRRTDIWSFGCLLYECLTGVRLFGGETVSDSLAAILREDPDWSLLPPDTPPMVRLLVRRCLARDPARRMQDAGDARIDLEEAVQDPSGSALGLAPAGDAPARTGRAGSWLPWLAAAAATLALVAALALREGPGPPARPMRLTIPVPGPTEFGDNRAAPPVISPDGRYVVFGVTTDSGDTSLWMRAIDDFSARPLAGTQGAAYPFWSPDSRQVAFFETGRIKRIEIGTGRVQTMGGASSAFPRGGSWNERGQVLFVPNSNTGVHLVDAAGGTPRQITAPDPDVPDSSHRWPWFLPDGEHFLFVSWTNDLRSRPQHGGIFVGSISGDEEPVRIVPDASSVVYSPPGLLLLVREGNLIAMPFDADSVQVTGEGRLIASGVLHNIANAHGAFSASMEGTLVYARGQASLPSSLIWYERTGEATPAPGEPAAYDELRLSPAADRAAAIIPGESGDGQVWIVDLVRGVRTRLTSGGWAFDNVVWSGDGERVLYTSQEQGTLNFEVRHADGSGEPVTLLADEKDKVLYDWSRDGRHLAYWPMGDGSGTQDIWIYSTQSETSEALIAGEPMYSDARFSPDGRWIAYESDDSGRTEVFIQAFSGDDGVKGGARWQASTAGGTSPHWREDGRELLYLDLQKQVVAVSLEVEDDRVVLGAPRELFRIQEMIVSMDATADHQRFLVAAREEIQAEPLYVVVNWLQDLD